MSEATTHECTFAEEREPSGRLILGPCLECGRPALEALETLKTAFAFQAKILCQQHIALMQIRDELGVPQPGYPAPVANAADIARAALAQKGGGE